MNKENEIKNFWNTQSDKYRDSYLATTPDFYSHQREMATLLEYLQDDIDVLEYGCGNGIVSRELFKTFNFNSYLGIDYSPGMITQSKIDFAKDGHCLKSTNCKYDVGDVRKHRSDHLVDYVFTDRCLINLKDHADQIKAVQNIHSNLKKDGIFLMMECSKKSLECINVVREKFDLEKINEHWHNCYIDEERFLHDIQKYFSLQKVDSFNSTYFLISRILNALITDESGKIDYRSEINRLAANLPPAGDYAPLKLFVLKKREE
jgi:SAM-dependent methyltransferase